MTFQQWREQDTGRYERQSVADDNEFVARTRWSHHRFRVQLESVPGHHGLLPSHRCPVRCPLQSLFFLWIFYLNKNKFWAISFLYHFDNYTKYCIFSYKSLEILIKTKFEIYYCELHHLTTVHWDICEEWEWSVCKSRRHRWRSNWCSENCVCVWWAKNWKWKVTTSCYFLIIK